MYNVTLKFKTEESKGRFTAWLSDGGGEDSYQDFLELHDQDFVSLTQEDDSWDNIIVE